MYDSLLNDATINTIKKEATELVSDLMKEDLVEMILYGSCSRGDYTEDSDIDIALLLKCDRLDSKRYTEALADIATSLAMKHFAIINFVRLPYNEFQEKRSWYTYFKNIALEVKNQGRERLM